MRCTHRSCMVFGNWRRGKNTRRGVAGRTASQINEMMAYYINLKTMLCKSTTQTVLEAPDKTLEDARAASELYA